MAFTLFGLCSVLPPKPLTNVRERFGMDLACLDNDDVRDLIGFVPPMRFVGRKTIERVRDTFGAEPKANKKADQKPNVRRQYGSDPVRFPREYLGTQIWRLVRSVAVRYSKSAHAGNTQMKAVQIHGGLFGRHSSSQSHISGVDRMKCEDLTQIGLVAVWEAANKGRIVGSGLGLVRQIRTIVHNAIRDDLRSRSKAERVKGQSSFGAHSPGQITNEYKGVHSESVCAGRIPDDSFDCWLKRVRKVFGDESAVRLASVRDLLGRGEKISDAVCTAAVWHKCHPNTIYNCLKNLRTDPELVNELVGD